jgi:hypothetical protein
MEMRPLTKGEVREKQKQKLEQRTLLDQWGVTEQDLRRSRRHALAARRLKRNDPLLLKRYGREAALQDLAEEELCCDLAGEFARDSAKKTEAKEIGSIRDNYEAIVSGFIRARSLSVVLRNETAQALGDFLKKFGKWIADYVSCRIQGNEDRYNWTLSGHTVSKGVLTALAQEYVRDRGGLMRFLSAVFKRWREIDQPDSLWRVRYVTQQHGGRDRKRIGEHLENIGAATNNESLRLRIGQYLSRDQKAALKRWGP